MRLSEAIRLGATHGPQLFGKWWDDKGGSCALGAIYIAIGKNSIFFPIEKCFPSLRTRLNSNGMTVQSAIATLNDYQHWSREEIADWIADYGHDCEYVPPFQKGVIQPAEEVACV